MRYFGDSEPCGEDVFLKKQRASRRNEKIARSQSRRKQKLSEAEEDYVRNLSDTAENGTGLACLDEEQLIESLGALGFSQPDPPPPTGTAGPTELHQQGPKLNKQVLFGSSDLESPNNFRHLNRSIKAFIKSSDEPTMKVAHAPPEVRKVIHEIGHVYKLKTFSTGKGEGRITILCKTESSTLGVNVHKLDRLIERGTRALEWRSSAAGRRQFTSSKGDAPSSSSRAVHGSVVGKGAKPIKDDNVGSRLLQKMGWVPGTGLGRDSEGAVDPVEAVVKTKRTGLGLDN